MDNNSWVPTRKWFASVVTATTGLFLNWATTGTWDVEETVMAITVVSGALITYLVPNSQPTP